MNNKKQLLEGVLSNIENSGLISRDTIVSLEDMYGHNIITNDIDIKRYTILPTKINYTETVDLLKKAINGLAEPVDIHAEIKYLSVIKKDILAVKDAFRGIYVNKERLIHLLDCENRNFAYNENLKLEDLRELPLTKLIREYKSWLDHVAESVSLYNPSKNKFTLIDKVFDLFQFDTIKEGNIDQRPYILRYIVNTIKWIGDNIFTTTRVEKEILTMNYTSIIDNVTINDLIILLNNENKVMEILNIILSLIDSENTYLLSEAVSGGNITNDLTDRLFKHIEEDKDTARVLLFLKEL